MLHSRSGLRGCRALAPDQTTGPRVMNFYSGSGLRSLGRRLPLAAVAFLAIAWMTNSGAAAADLQTLEIATKSGVQIFSVEVAATEEQKRTGLMYRKKLPDGQGMLFDFSPEQEVSMWMKNTYVSLDMIFIRADGRILRIAENTEPLSTRIIPSGGLARGVLEVAAGTARKYGIAPGDRVAYPLFDGR